MNQRNSSLLLFSLLFPPPDKTEIPIFVELASISAGENDMDIDRVRFFRDAMAASAPVILDLSPDAGFDQFSTALSFIEKAVVKDNKLPKKLVSSISKSHQDTRCEAKSPMGV